MNAVEIILRYVAVFRRFGIPVTFEPGWETRGNGQTANYRGAVGHHTASPASDTRPQALVTGRPDLPGPLCNLAGLWSGGIHVVAAHPANHAGASGGPSMGPLPVTRLFNPLVVGLEIVYPGTSAMSPAQYRTYLVFIYATAEIFGGGVRPDTVELTRGHYETSIEGKPDPAWSMSPWRPYDMNIMRQEALTLTEDELTPDQMSQLADMVVNRVFGRSVPLKQYPTGVVNVSYQGSSEYADYRAQSNGAAIKAVATVVNAIATAVAELVDNSRDVQLAPEQLQVLRDDLLTQLQSLEDAHTAELERLRVEHAEQERLQAEAMERRLNELAEQLDGASAATIRRALQSFYAPAVEAAVPQA